MQIFEAGEGERPNLRHQAGSGGGGVNAALGPTLKKLTSCSKWGVGHIWMMPPPHPLSCIILRRPTIKPPDVINVDPNDGYCQIYTVYHLMDLSVPNETQAAYNNEPATNKDLSVEGRRSAQARLNYGGAVSGSAHVDTPMPYIGLFVPFLWYTPWSVGVRALNATHIGGALKGTCVAPERGTKRPPVIALAFFSACVSPQYKQAKLTQIHSCVKIRGKKRTRIVTLNSLFSYSWHTIWGQIK